MLTSTRFGSNRSRSFTSARKSRRGRLQAAARARACLLPAMLLTMLLSTVAPAAQPPARGPRARLQGDGLPSSTPEAQGMDSALLAQAVDYLASQRDRYYIHSMTILRHGAIVADVSFWPFQLHELHETSSGGKPTISVLMGIAIDKGYIASVDEPVLGFFPDCVIAHRDAWKEAMTIGHLLSMTSGLGGVLPYEDEADALSASDDWLQFALDLPMTTEPGTVWRYSNPNCYLLSAVLQQATGMNAFQFANEHLMGPLGVTRWSWDESPQGINDGSGGQALSPQAWAKLGQVMLQKGTWRGRELISRAWVEASTSVHSPEVDSCYLWSWYPDLDAYWAGGSQGQRLVVSEEHDVVAVFTGGGYAHEDIESIYKESLRSYIYAAAISDAPLPPNPAGMALLQAAIQRVASCDREPTPVGPLPPIAAAISGLEYVIDFPSGDAVMTLSFPSNEEGRVALDTTHEVIEGAPFEWAAGLDGIERLARGRFGMLAAGTGEWTSGNTFVMNVDELGNRNVFRLTFVFDGDSLNLTIEDTYWWRPDPPIVVTGRAR